MRMKQISVFVENKMDQISEITRILGENNINIKFASVADTAEFGILRMISNEPERAVSVLENTGIAVRLSDVTAIEMPDRPNGLAEILKVLSDANINIEYMYAFVGRHEKTSVVVFKADNAELAEDCLAKSGIADINARNVIDNL